MQTLTAEQFKARYGQQGLDSFGVSPTKPSNPSLTDTVGTDIANRVQKLADIQARTDTGPVTKAVQTFGQGAGLAANTLETAVSKIPGVSQVAKGIGEGINWLATSDISPIKHLGDLIGSDKTLQTATKLYDTDQNFKDTIDAVANIVRLGGDVQTAVDSANFTKNVTNKVIKSVKSVSDSLPSVSGAVDSSISTIGEVTKNTPANIMNRVARLKPTDATKFEQLAGKSHGQYLSETGNFGSPDKIIAKEAVKFVQSMDSVDNALSQLPGVYKDGSVSDALRGLQAKAQSVSTGNVKSPYYSQVNDLIKKYNSGGLTMEDINAVKRLYEKNVKLGYNKLINADKVEQATNIDNALRKWQVQKAKDLGFNNISELNKQTQISKFIVNKLGDQVIGQNGLNSIGLTDWVMLSGGNPQAVAGFLTKKFFSSKAVQAKIAEMLSQGEIKGQIPADITPTLENNMRRVFPQGTKLELPAGDITKPQVENHVPVQRNAPFSSEAPAENINRTSYNPKTKTEYVKNAKTGKLEIFTKNTKKK